MIHTKKTLLVSLVAALSLTGCATNGDGEMSNSAKGAAIGAIAGAILGKSTANHDDRRAAIGAVLGGIAGAAVGDYMDKQEKELQEELGDTDITVSRDGDNITLNIPNQITFAVDQSSLMPSLKPILVDVTKVLEKYQQTIVYVKGHTDSTGSEQYNYQLSERRALSVSEFMNSQGLSPERMIVVGFGETRPISTNETTEGRAQNRRVEIHLEPVVAK